MAAPFEQNHVSRPKVGVGVLIKSSKHPNCVIIGKRKNVDGDGNFAFPGGHLEFAENWEECAIRETEEETGLRIKKVKFCTVINAVSVEDNYHYVVIFMEAEIDMTYQEEPVNMEPHKCEGWEWWDWDKFPSAQKLFCPLRVFRETGYNPFCKSSDNAV
ncbi:nucleotide triphosphate diphosphatase NUDT15-like [Asterias amurensis]|uniref:nucleotide triphosphate diphosphatase NUDT15-like n=1 Tax=Asterias amurensis TaxID=7602 RepID=UPI003AB1E706